MAVKCNPDWRDANWAFYRFVPSVAAAIIFCLLFLFATGLHIYQMWKAKAWFLTALVVGCVCTRAQNASWMELSLTLPSTCIVEVIGFAARTASARQDPGCWTLMPYIIQSMFILLAPALFAASIYIILGRIILLTDGEIHSVIRQRRLTKIFVIGDILCFTLQCGGKTPPFPVWSALIGSDSELLQPAVSWLEEETTRT